VTCVLRPEGGRKVEEIKAEGRVFVWKLEGYRIILA
jgi:hypothetical protein